MAKKFFDGSTPPLQLGVAGFAVALIGFCLGYTGFVFGSRFSELVGYVLVALGVIIGLMSMIWGWLDSPREFRNQLDRRTNVAVVAVKSVEQTLFDKFGHDQYEAWQHSNKNRAEIERSDRCACWFCNGKFEPKEVRRWVDEGLTACCPRCGLANCVIGSASGLPLSDEFLSLVRAHWA